MNPVFSSSEDCRDFVFDARSTLVVPDPVLQVIVEVRGGAGQAQDSGSFDTVWGWRSVVLVALL